jgi:hypothetical protein
MSSRIVAQRPLNDRPPLLDLGPMVGGERLPGSASALNSRFETRALISASQSSGLPASNSSARRCSAAGAFISALAERRRIDPRQIALRSQ